MDISKYTSCFHDGWIEEVEYKDDNIIFVMTSAQMADEENIDNIPLSKDDYMQGKLHVEGIKKITVNDQLITQKLQKKHDFGDIFHLKINKNNLVLDLEWRCYSSLSDEEFVKIKIECEKIWWENIPDLIDTSIPTDN